MATRFQDYLAAQVLNEGNIVSYRLLSRALKLHSNAAKEALYDFHRSQNARRPGSLHATYLLSGTRKPDPGSTTNGGSSQDAEDSFMADSSFMDSSMPDHQEDLEEIPVTWVSLTREEDLEAMRETFETITSMHVYSLEPGPLQNLHIVSDCNRKTYSEHISDDLLETWKDYGTIHNPDAKRRTARQPPLPQQGATAPVTAAMKPKNIVVEPKGTETKATHPKVEPPKIEAKTDERPTTVKGKAKAPTLKKESSSIFKSFAKAKELKKEHSVSDASAAASPAVSAAEDEVMKDASEDEQEEDVPLPDSTEAQEKVDANRKARLEREQQLRKMMEEEENDEPMPDNDVAPPEELDPPEEPAAAEPEPEPEPQVTVAGGRRRGRRRIMKKKTFKDADGYLVTKEEPAWESFSEEEPQPKKAKTAAPPTTAATKGKKSGKPGQGNIMSFFAKK